eukprot:CAMPEP_0195148776 /NCGR_PEP_ID=MMETSP0448-20130528/175876_1 /TAXON_ID=66468 /ORGANISM="Heterocapsa triquestra, Strain CCMP 448" /LENGTH=59 /DNA_ID=CAMNT_0040187397 /DNA_START=144 /DNA_END=323 /DNA_ORIENTATION=+
MTMAVAGTKHALVQAHGQHQTAGAALMAQPLARVRLARHAGHALVQAAVMEGDGVVVAA